MLKIVLPNKTKHSFDYNLDAPIKEIFQKFCAKKGLLEDMYEIYDPNKLIDINNKKSPRFYNFKKIYIRRVTEPRSSTDDLLNKSSNYDIQKNGNIGRFQFFNRKPNQPYPKKVKINNTATEMDLKGNVNTPQIPERLKRQAPAIPVVITGPALNNLEEPDIEIPSPPAYSSLQYEDVQYLPGHVNKGCNTEMFLDCEDPTYASLMEYISPEYDVISETLDKYVNATIPQEMTRTEKNFKEDNLFLLERRISDDEDFSDPEDHVYSIITRKSETKMDREVELTVNIISSENVDHKDQFSLLKSKTDNMESLLETDLLKKPEIISFEKENECDSSASETSSIGTPRINQMLKPNSSKAKLIYRIITKNEPLKPLILVPKPRAINNEYQKPADNDSQKQKTSLKPQVDLTVKKEDQKNGESLKSLHCDDTIQDKPVITVFKVPDTIQDKPAIPLSKVQDTIQDKPVIQLSKVQVNKPPKPLIFVAKPRAINNEYQKPADHQNTSLALAIKPPDLLKNSK